MLFIGIYTYDYDVILTYWLTIYYQRFTVNMHIFDTLHKSIGGNSELIIRTYHPIPPVTPGFCIECRQWVGNPPVYRSSVRTDSWSSIRFHSYGLGVWRTGLLIEFNYHNSAQEPSGSYPVWTFRIASWRSTVIVHSPRFKGKWLGFHSAFTYFCEAAPPASGYLCVVLW